MLYLISLGLNDEKDISIKGLELVKKSKKVYLENYTSKMQCSKEDLERFYGKPIIEVNRNFVEKEIKTVFNESKKEDIAFLVKGDVYSATTHIDIYLRAKKEKVNIVVIPSTSILTAVGCIGLSLYNFGKTISIPFSNEKIKSPYDNFLINKKNGMHTLFLLDLAPEENKFLTIKQGLEYLKRSGLNENELVICCARIASPNQVIKAGKLKEIMNFDFGKPPFCIIVPGKLHFMEEEALDLWK